MRIECKHSFYIFCFSFLRWASTAPAKARWNGRPSVSALSDGVDRRDVPLLPRHLQRQGKRTTACEAIEASDCLLSIGYRPIEVTTGDFTASLPVNTIHARGHSVDIGDDNHQAVTLREVLTGVVDRVPQVANRPPRHDVGAAAGSQADGSASLTQAAYWRAIQGYLRPGDVLYVDNGTSFALFGLKLPPNCTFVGSVT